MVSRSKLAPPIRTAALLLGAALVMGGFLRFYALGHNEMSADEGASWTAAAAPTIGEVMRLQYRLDPGKAGLHDLALHLWMRAFGASLPAMRSLSAAAGTLAIVLVFILTREMFSPTDASADPVAHRDLTAGVAAVIFAVNLVSIKYSREARMYSLFLAATLAQVACLWRAARRGGWSSYAGVAIFTATALAAHFAAILVFASEGVWLAFGFFWPATGDERPKDERRKIAAVIAAMFIGGAILLPLAPAILHANAPAAAGGVYNWIPRPAWWAPIALFNKASGTFPFPLMVLAAAWGAVYLWRQARRALAFLLLWMWGPPLLALALSYALRPCFVERYMLPSFASFFILIALGVTALSRPALKAAALALLVAVALGHVGAWGRKAHDVQWREATLAAIAAAGTDGTVAVAPAYAANVVRYYQAADPSKLVAPGGTSATVAIVATGGIAQPVAAILARTYPEVVARFRGVTVRRGRAAPAVGNPDFRQPSR